VSGVINFVSTVAFIAALAWLIVRLRKLGNHWSSPDGMRCICQMSLASDDQMMSWREVRVTITPDRHTLLTRSRGAKGARLRGEWKVIGIPHSSHVAPENGVLHVAVSSTLHTERLAIIRIPDYSASSVVLKTMIPN
jgi:hypothetical protein